jgi:hypothetical protein
VTNIVSPYSGGVDSAASATPVEIKAPIRSPLRAPARGETMQASNTANSHAL